MVENSGFIIIIAVIIFSLIWTANEKFKNFEKRINYLEQARTSLWNKFKELQVEIVQLREKIKEIQR